MWHGACPLPFEALQSELIPICRAPRKEKFECGPVAPLGLCAERGFDTPGSGTELGFLTSLYAQQFLLTPEVGMPDCLGALARSDHWEPTIWLTPRKITGESPHSLSMDIWQFNQVNFLQVSLEGWEPDDYILVTNPEYASSLQHPYEPALRRGVPPASWQQIAATTLEVRVELPRELFDPHHSPRVLCRSFQLAGQPSAQVTVSVIVACRWSAARCPRDAASGTIPIRFQ